MTDALDRLAVPCLLLILGTIVLLAGYSEIGYTMIGVGIGVPAKQRFSQYKPK